MVKVLAFDRETVPDWDKEIAEDVKGECGKFGAVSHIYVDRNSKVSLGLILGLKHLSNHFGHLLQYVGLQSRRWSCCKSPHGATTLFQHGIRELLTIASSQTRI